MGSSGVPAAALRASVFFTTEYETPASRNCRRSSWSLATVMFLKLTSIAAFACLNCSARASRSFCFSALLFILSSPIWQTQFHQQQSRAHSRRQIHLLHVLALGR